MMHLLPWVLLTKTTLGFNKIDLGIIKFINFEVCMHVWFGKASEMISL